jgi:dienelactone hydrolase
MKKVLATLVCAAAFAAASVASAPAAEDTPKKLLQDWFKAKKDADREKARAAIAEAGAVPDDAFEELRDLCLQSLAKAGRVVAPKGRNEWFDEKKDGWKGLYIAGGGGRKGLVLALHGGGEGSGDAGSAFSSFSGPIGSLGYRTLSPEVLKKTEHGWTDPPETERWVMDLVKRARASWGIDANRVYITGHSMGGFGTWTYGSIYADLFGGGAAFAGAPSVYWKEGRKDQEAEAVIEGVIPNLYNLPLFVYQSLDDKNVPAAANIRAAAELKEAHASDAKGWNFVYEQVDGRGHDFPQKGPGPGLQWMAGHERNPRPVKIIWQPVRTWKTTFYWLRWTDPWIGCTLTATIDRARNAVDIVVARPRGIGVEAGAKTLDAKIRTLSVYLDARVLDVAREVLVTVDGKERYRGVPAASLEVLLRSAEEREDPEYVFTREAAMGDAK